MDAERKIPWTFLHACDSHLGTPRSYRFRPAIKRRWAAIKRQMAAIDAEFLLHGGDLVDGIRIYRSPAAGNTPQLAERWPDAETRFGFHRCDVGERGIEVTFIPGDDQCEEFDTYGPLGHPAIEERDYSKAREYPPLRPDRPRA